MKKSVLDEASDEFNLAVRLQRFVAKIMFI